MQLSEHLLSYYSCKDKISVLAIKLSCFLGCALQVFPPLPLKLDYSFFEREKTSRSLVPKEGKPCPVYITPITG